MKKQKDLFIGLLKAIFALFLWVFKHSVMGNLKKPMDLAAEKQLSCCFYAIAIFSNLILLMANFRSFSSSDGDLCQCQMPLAYNLLMAQLDGNKGKAFPHLPHLVIVIKVYSRRDLQQSGNCISSREIYTKG
jgi:hypothetical protein